VDGTALEVLVERGRMLAGNLASSIDVAERPLDRSQELVEGRIQRLDRRPRNGSDMRGVVTVADWRSQSRGLRFM
jgi:hypothetical protein